MYFKGIIKRIVSDDETEENDNTPKTKDSTDDKLNTPNQKLEKPKRTNKSGSKEKKVVAIDKIQKTENAGVKKSNSNNIVTNDIFSDTLITKKLVNIDNLTNKKNDINNKLAKNTRKQIKLTSNGQNENEVVPDKNAKSAKTKTNDYHAELNIIILNLMHSRTLIENLLSLKKREIDDIRRAREAAGRNMSDDSNKLQPIKLINKGDGDGKLSKLKEYFKGVFNKENFKNTFPNISQFASLFKKLGPLLGKVFKLAMGPVGTTLVGLYAGVQLTRGAIEGWQNADQIMGKKNCDTFDKITASGLMAVEKLTGRIYNIQTDA
jgi:hypothetical protein